MREQDRITVLHPMQLLDQALSGKDLHGLVSQPWCSSSSVGGCSVGSRPERSLPRIA
jgi:hypothetical protein